MNYMDWLGIYSIIALSWMIPPLLVAFWIIRIVLKKFFKSQHDLLVNVSAYVLVLILLYPVVSITANDNIRPSSIIFIRMTFAAVIGLIIFIGFEIIDGRRRKKLVRELN